MCGNQVSTVVEPSGNLREQINNQIQTGKIKISNYRLTMSDALAFRTFNTHNVKQIQFTKCEIDHQILQQILKSDLANLRRFSLNKNKIGPIGCRVLASTQSLRNLQSLQLNDNKIRDVGVKSLSTGFFSQLQDLSLNDNNLTIDGVSSLQNFTNISYLGLSGNKLNDSGIQTLKNINPDGLVFLCLSRNDFTDKSLGPLLEIEGLSVLMLDRNKIKKNRSEISVPKQVFLFY